MKKINQTTALLQSALQTVKKTATPAKVAFAAIAATTLISTSGCMIPAYIEARKMQRESMAHLKESRERMKEMSSPEYQERQRQEALDMQKQMLQMQMDMQRELEAERHKAKMEELQMQQQIQQQQPQQ